MTYLKVDATRFLPLIALAVALTQGIAGPSPVDAQEHMTIQGRVTNGTQGATLEPELAVMLLSFDQSGSPVASAQTTTEKSARDAGSFRFTEVPLQEGGTYAVSVDYGGMFYSALVSPKELADPVELVVYETTRDVSVVRIERHALVVADINVRDREIAAVEFIRLSNNSDRTLMPDLTDVSQFSFLRFSLPPEAAGLDVQSDLAGGDVIPVGTGFAITAPVPPGEYGINFSFRFPYEGNAAAYRQNLLQGADVYQVLAPDRLPGIQVAPLESMPAINLSGSVYRVWEGRDFGPGEGLMLELTQLPQPGIFTRLGKSATDQGFWRIAIPSALGGALALLLIYGGFKAPGAATATPDGAPAIQNRNDASSDNRDGSRNELILSVASLDESFQQGGLAEYEYRRQRNQLIARIREAEVTTPERHESREEEADS